MGDERKNDIEPEELADETLTEIQGGRGYASTQATIKPKVKTVVKPIGGVGETPPLDVTHTIVKTR